VRRRLVCLLLIATGLAACAGPESLVRRRDYVGVPLAPHQQATVFAVWDTGDGALTYLCEVDGRSYRRLGYANPCPSVLYVLPGEHRIGVESHRGPRVAVIVVGLRAEAARTYEISVDSRAEGAAFYVREMDPGFTLTYKDVAPTFFRKGDRVNTPIDPAEAD
jgi:hypothetical protein